MIIAEYHGRHYGRFLGVALPSFYWTKGPPAASRTERPGSLNQGFSLDHLIVVGLSVSPIQTHRNIRSAASTETSVFLCRRCPGGRGHCRSPLKQAVYGDSVSSSSFFVFKRLQPAAVRSGPSGQLPRGSRLVQAFLGYTATYAWLKRKWGVGGAKSEGDTRIAGSRLESLQKPTDRGTSKSAIWPGLSHYLGPLKVAAGLLR